ncbi:GH36-type glycosyl hydrolase domain-containing protein [Candidatus Izemoplasma sp. B36]|uniref:GH36-type glycosyl hydrolase domain-containing protein n=1 Tax=Candidatus Izemoplasma sp. B36 TaxID=3242468 RepID=UPI0035591360
MLKNKYGFFSENMKEYIITNPRTPKPWINVISNSDYSLMISQTGGGCSWRSNAGQNRLTRLYQDIIKDNFGKYFYLRDLTNKSIWSLTYQPMQVDYQDFEVRHGIGYSIFKYKVNDILSEMKVFVVPNKPLEIIEIKIKNTSKQSRTLDLTSYFEWEAGIHPDEHREFHKLFMETFYEEDLKAIKLKKYTWGFGDKHGLQNNVDWDFVGFHAVSEEVKSFETDKEKFLGMYNSEKNPNGLANDKLSNSFGRFGDPTASLQTEFTLEPNEEKTIVYTIGVTKLGKNEIPGIEQTYEDPDDLIKEYTNVNASKNAFQEVLAFWDELLSGDEVNTPDNAFDIMTNNFAKYQAISCRLWGKTAYYQTSAGYGFRDQLQDSLIFLESKPELTKKQLLLHAAKQFQEGDVNHWFVTYQGWGPRGNCSDDLLWMPYILYFYLEETLDYSILSEVVPFANGNDATLYEHSKRAIQKSLTRFSDRKVPLMGSHDWNDGLSAVGFKMKGESFWMSSFLYIILNQFQEIAKKQKDENFITECKKYAKIIKDSFNEYGWDGSWYLQATTDDGLKVGSFDNDEGKIFLMPNSWAIISDILPKERKDIVIKSIEKYLLKDHGTLLNYPAFTKPRTDIGYVTRYAPGLRENGGVYTHAATWAVTAFAKAGYPELAYKAYKGICPPNRTKDPDKYLAEPYVTCGNSDGPISPMYGRGGWSWYTGSAQWLHRVAVQDIIGVKATFDGLKVSPKIPLSWNKVTYNRKFRNAHYHFEIERSDKKEILVDGVKLESDIIPDFRDSKEHFIIVKYKE